MADQAEKRKLFSFFSLLLFGSSLFLILTFAYLFYSLQPASSASEKMGEAKKTVKFQIVKGESFRDISARLSQQALIKSITVFKLYSLLTGKIQKFQPGVYELSDNLSVPQIVEILTAGGKNEVTVTFFEGLALRDIGDILFSLGVLPKKDALLEHDTSKMASIYPFLANAPSLEGFIFPDTYRFNFNSSPEAVLQTMLNNFEAKAWPMLKDVENWYEVLILASFLEREVPDFNDQQIVAGILLKRLKLAMPLQVDATITYAKCNGRFRACPDLLVKAEDLKIASPYNTYTHLGFTPTPIANPGEQTIKAALSPKSSPYLYYLSAAKTKKTIFSKTLEEHNRNRAKYL